jgi:hypothetical protein
LFLLKINSEKINYNAFCRDSFTGLAGLSRGLYVHSEEKRRRISMLGMGFELVILAYERFRFIHAIDNADTEIGLFIYLFVYLSIYL